MNRRKLVLFGTGEMAQVAHTVFSFDSNYEVVAFTANREWITADSCCGVPVVPFESVEVTHPPREYDMFVAVGYSNMNRNREKIFFAAREKGYTLASYLSSKALTWPGFELRENVMILEFNNIQPHTVIGENVIIWSSNHIGHHSVVDDHVYIASHCCVSGQVTIRSNSFLGVNCAIRNGITLGRYSLAGAGAYIAADLGEEGIVVPPRCNLLERSSLDINI